MELKGVEKHCFRSWDANLMEERKGVKCSREDEVSSNGLLEEMAMTVMVLPVMPMMGGSSQR